MKRHPDPILLDCLARFPRSPAVQDPPAVVPTLHVHRPFPELSLVVFWRVVVVVVRLRLRRVEPYRARRGRLGGRWGRLLPVRVRAGGREYGAGPGRDGRERGRHRSSAR